MLYVGLILMVKNKFCKITKIKSRYLLFIFVILFFLLLFKFYNIYINLNSIIIVNHSKHTIRDVYIKDHYGNELVYIGNLNENESYKYFVKTEGSINLIFYDFNSIMYNNMIVGYAYDGMRGVSVKILSNENDVFLKIREI